MDDYELRHADEEASVAVADATSGSQLALNEVK